MEKALILHSHASASELIHFQYDSFRNALILNNYASALEFIQFQYNSWRTVLILDSHASQPLNWLFLNAILKEKQSCLRLKIDYFSIDSSRKVLILDSHASASELNHFHEKEVVSIRMFIEEINDCEPLDVYKLDSLQGFPMEISMIWSKC